MDFRKCAQRNLGESRLALAAGLAMAVEELGSNVFHAVPARFAPFEFLSCQCTIDTSDRRFLLDQDNPNTGDTCRTAVPRRHCTCRLTI